MNIVLFTPPHGLLVEEDDYQFLYICFVGKKHGVIFLFIDMHAIMVQCKVLPSSLVCVAAAVQWNSLSFLDYYYFCCFSLCLYVFVFFNKCLTSTGHVCLLHNFQSMGVNVGH